MKLLNLLTLWWPFERPTAVIPPTVPGMEYNAPDTRLHYSIPDTRLHAKAPDTRLHAASQEE